MRTLFPLRVGQMTALSHYCHSHFEQGGRPLNDAAAIPGVDDRSATPQLFALRTGGALLCDDAAIPTSSGVDDRSVTLSLFLPRAG